MNSDFLDAFFTVGALFFLTILGIWILTFILTYDDQ